MRNLIVALLTSLVLSPVSGPGEGGHHTEPAASHSPTPADDRTKAPEVFAPLPARTLQIEGAERSDWGLRRFAAEADRRIPGLRVFTRGTCAQRPRAVCVRVFEGRWSEEEASYISGASEGWLGLTTYPSPRARVVWLNAALRTSGRYAVAAHEFGHVLGLTHHNAIGVDGRTPDVVHLSPAEVRALRAAYPAA